MRCGEQFNVGHILNLAQGVVSDGLDLEANDVFGRQDTNGLSPTENWHETTPLQHLQTRRTERMQDIDIAPGILWMAVMRDILSEGTTRIPKRRQQAMEHTKIVPVNQEIEVHCGSRDSKRT